MEQLTPRIENQGVGKSIEARVEDSGAEFGAWGKGGGRFGARAPQSRCCPFLSSECGATVKK